jgi:alpha-tubulin suppressor-like RCC1 family protein
VGPLRVNGLENVTAIAAGNNHALALRADGSVWAWGRNNFNQAGNGTGTSPSAIEGLPKVDNSTVKVKALAASAYNSAVLYSDGSVWAWGRNYYGQLGLDKGEVVRKPVRLTIPGVAVGLAMASDTIIVLNKDGSVYGIGVNSSGQIGNNSQTNVLVPTQVSGAGGHGFLDLGKSAGN